jgi:hypothetical protein
MRVPLATVLLGGLICASLHAAPITGTFNIAGTITVTNTNITWTLNDVPFTADKATIGPGDTGSFAPLAGSMVTIHDLTNGPLPLGQPVGVNIAPAFPFISFDSPIAIAAGFPTLNLNFIFPGIYSSAACGTLPPAVGQTCTPSVPGGSPFNFVNNPPPAPLGPQATATFAFQGVTSDGLENWIGNFTSQFTVPYQTVLSQLGTTGSVTNTFSASFTLSPVPPVPEAGTMSLLGLGLVAFSYKLRRRRS